MANLRFVVIVAFAVLGSVLSANAMPHVLDWVFAVVQQVSRAWQEQAQEPTLEGKQRPKKVLTYRFRRIPFDTPSLTSEARVREAERALEELRKGAYTFEELARSRRVPGIQFNFEASQHKLQSRPDLQPLEFLRLPGELSEVVIDQGTGFPTLYQLVERTEVTPVEEPVEETGYPGARAPHVIAALAVLGAIIGGALGGLTVRGFDRWAVSWQRMDTGDKVTLFLGVFAGVVGSLPFLIAFGNLGPVAAPLITLGLTIGFSALAVQALRSMEEVLPWHAKGKRRRTGTKIFDTNVLIDGRIFDLARTGFLEGDFYVPQFVLAELQRIADSADPLRRQRGRRGLDVLRLLQDDYTVEIGTQDRHAADAKKPVDDRLVLLAKAIGADLVTNDYNLNQVASLQNVRVLNVNDLALALRPNLLPGESIDLTIIREGNQHMQGVGYLDDGTMVIVEGGKPHVGESVHVNVTQVIQTERGKLIFGELPTAERDQAAARKPPSPRTGRS